MYNLRKFYMMFEYKQINNSCVYKPCTDVIKINGNSYNVEMNIDKLIYNCGDDDYDDDDYDYDDDDYDYNDIFDDEYIITYNVTKKICYKKYNITVHNTFMEYTNLIRIYVHDINKKKTLTIHLRGMSCNFCITEAGMSTINRDNLDIHKAIILLKIFLNGIYRGSLYEKSVKGISSLLY